MASKNFVKLVSKFIFFLAIGCVFFSCGTDRFIHLNSSKVHSNNVLRWMVEFSTMDSSVSYISYWRTGKQKKLYSQSARHVQDHRIELINLLPNEDYSYKLHANSGDEIFESEVFYFRTDSLPDIVPDYHLAKKEFSFSGYILLKKFAELACFVLLDDSARVVWYEPYDTTMLRPFQWTNDNTIVSLQDSTTIVEFDLHGKMYNRVNIKDHGINTRIHHELFKNTLGQYVFLNYDYKFIDLSAVGGHIKDTVRTDGIMVIDSLGKVLWEWSVFDVSDPTNDPDIVQYKQDWGHANSISYDTDNNYLVSFRDFNQIWKLDQESGAVIWRFGTDGDFSLSSDEYTIKQHAAHINRDGDLMVFDNGNAKRGHSRIASYQLDEHNMTVRININFALEKTMTTFRMGSAYMIDDRYILVCSPKKILGLGIYDLKGESVWEITGSNDSYRALYLDRSDIENEKPF